MQAFGQLSKQETNGPEIDPKRPALTPPNALKIIETSTIPSGTIAIDHDPSLRPEFIAESLSVLQESGKPAAYNAQYLAWLDFIASGNFQQANQCFRHDFAVLLKEAPEADHLIAFIEYSLIHQSFNEARVLIQAAQLHPSIQDNSSAAKRLELLAFIHENITGVSASSISNRELCSAWNTAEHCSHQVKLMLLDSLLNLVTQEMAHGQRRVAIKILNSMAANAHRSGPIYDSIINALRHACSYGTWKSARSHLSRKARRSSHIAFKNKLACAIDSIAVYANGQLVIVHGWIVSDPASTVSISLAINRSLFTAPPALLRRHQRPDLVPIAKRYGIDGQDNFGFSCTFFPEPGFQSLSDWSDSRLYDIIISADETSAALAARSFFKELALSDVRAIVSQIVSNDLRICNYICAQQIKRIWSQRIEAQVSEQAEHFFFGKNDVEPDISILIPLYGRIDFMEFQLHCFFSQKRSCGDFQYRYQLIYCLDDPANRDNLLRIAAKCAMLYQIPFEVVINSMNLGFAASNNVAAKHARASTLLLLNSDVIPRDHDAIDILIDAYRKLPPNKGALGAKLLYPSNDIQHVGMSFYKDSSLPGILSQCWLNEHPHKHIKHTSNPNLQTGIIEAEAATAACLLIEKGIFNELGGFSLDYISGDFEDSDLCLRLREAGRSVLVCLDAVFFHLERQSMILQSGHEREALKLVAFNAYTHHEHHSATIERIKSGLKDFS